LIFEVGVGVYDFCVYPLILSVAFWEGISTSNNLIGQSDSWNSTTLYVEPIAAEEAVVQKLH
jgi:hypothetical protein